MHTLFTTKECNRVLYLSPLSLPVVVVFTTVRNTFRHLLRVSRGQSLFRRRKAIEVSLDDVFFFIATVRVPVFVFHSTPPSLVFLFTVLFLLFFPELPVSRFLLHPLRCFVFLAGSRCTRLAFIDWT